MPTHTLSCCWMLFLILVGLPSLVSSQCPGGMNMIVPLYGYPSADWNTVASSASTITTIAVINPNNGPGGPPNADFVDGVNNLYAAGVTVMGYVCVNYSKVPLSAVQEEIDIYINYWTHISGIFIDMVTTDPSYLDYFQSLHDYIIGKGYSQVIINPGTIPDPSYANVATMIVVLENYASIVPQWNPSWLNCINNANYAAILHNALDTSTMEVTIDAIKGLGVIGWMYVTDGSGYNKLASYYQSEVLYILQN